MSIFSKIKGAKKAAEDHKKSQQNPQPGDTPKEAYKHVPTHAAQDAATANASTPADMKDRIRQSYSRQSTTNSSTGTDLSVFARANLARHSSGDLVSSYKGKGSARTSNEFTYHNIAGVSRIQSDTSIPTRGTLSSRSSSEAARSNGMPSRTNSDMSLASMQHRHVGFPPPAARARRPFPSHGSSSSLARISSPLAHGGSYKEPLILHRLALTSFYRICSRRR